MPWGENCQVSGPVNPLFSFLLDVDHWCFHKKKKKSGLGHQNFSWIPCAPEVALFQGPDPDSQPVEWCQNQKNIFRQNVAWLSLSVILVCLTHCFVSSLMNLYRFLSLHVLIPLYELASFGRIICLLQATLGKSQALYSSFIFGQYFQHIFPK